MKNFRKHDVPLKFRNYLNTTQLPMVPKAFGHVSNTPPGRQSAWGMLGNDQYGCCVLAGAAHEEMMWASASHHQVPMFTTQSIVGQYMRLTGGSDTGLDPVSVAKVRQTVGIVDANRNVYKIKAFGLIDSLQELEYAVYLFGAAGIGLFLPSSCTQQFESHEPWDDLSKPVDLNAGHYVPIVGKNSQGLWVCVTWNELQGITDAYLKKYCFDGGAGGLAFFSKSYLLDTGKSPEAFDEAQLDADLLTIPGLSNIPPTA